MKIKFFDSIEEQSRQLFYAVCSDIARLNLDYDDGNQHKVIILNMKDMRSKLKLPACHLNRDEDFTNYVIAIENANLNAVTLFTELGCDPFSESNVFHNRLLKNNPATWQQHSVDYFECRESAVVIFTTAPIPCAFVCHSIGSPVINTPFL